MPQITQTERDSDSVATKARLKNVITGILGQGRRGLSWRRARQEGWYNDPATLGDVVNAIVYYGNIRDVLVPPERR